MMTHQILTAEAAVNAAGLSTAPGHAYTVTVVAEPQAPPAAPAAAPGTGVVAGAALVILLLGFYLHMQLKGKKVKVPPVLASFTLGVLLAGSVVGAVAINASNTAGASLTQLFTTVTGPGGQTTTPTGGR